jgi:hypothetical protein
MISSGIEHTILRIVSQYLNQLHYRVFESMSLALSEEYRLRMSENKVPSRIFGLKETGSNRIIQKITNEELSHI